MNHMCEFRRKSRVSGRAGNNHSDGPGPDWLILAIGNPGPQYADSRHNVGWWVADIPLKRHRARLEDSGVARLAKLKLDTESAVLAYPKTYVNRSGSAAKTLLERYGIAPTRLLVICDDINLPVGRLRVRRKGGAGGHNGLASIIDTLNTDDFPRIRIGVGKQPDGESQVDHVLGRPDAEESAQLNLAVKRGADAVETAIREGVEAAMNAFNQRVASEEG